MGQVWHMFTEVGIPALIVSGTLFAVISIFTTAYNTFNSGVASLNSSTAELLETTLTRYDGALVAGSSVVSVIKTYWASGNTVAITVCTKDGTNIMYDYAGNVYSEAITDALSGWPDKFADGNTFDATQLTPAFSELAGDNWTNYQNSMPAVRNESTGYGTTDSNAAGYINTNAQFEGSVQRDVNNTIRGLTFVQQ